MRKIIDNPKISVLLNIDMAEFIHHGRRSVDKAPFFARLLWNHMNHTLLYAMPLVGKEHPFVLETHALWARSRQR